VKFYAPQTLERVAQKWHEETAELAERVARGRVRVPVEQHSELKNHVQRLLARAANPALRIEYERTMLLLSARTYFSSRINNQVYEATLQHNRRQVSSKQTSRTDRALFAAACAHAIEHPSVSVHLYTRDDGLVQLFENHVRILRCTHLPLDAITERVYLHTALGVQRKILASDWKTA
jgi:hypothetical protein